MALRIYQPFPLAGGSALKFGITYEIFLYVGRSYKELRSSARPVLHLVILALFAAAIVLAQHTPPNGTDDPTMFTVRLIDRSVAFLQCGLMLGLLSLSRILNMRWQKAAFGIALGLAITASANLILLAI